MRQRYAGRTVLDVGRAGGAPGRGPGPGGPQRRREIHPAAPAELPGDAPPAGRCATKGGRLTGERTPLELRRQVTTVFQRPVLQKTSVRANVAYGLRLRGLRVDGQVDGLLATVGLAELASSPGPPAFRRRDAAGGPGPGPGHPAARAAAGRADRQPGPLQRQPHRADHPRREPGPRHHRGAGDPQRVPGPPAGAPHRAAAERAPGGAGRHGLFLLLALPTRAPPPSSAGRWCTEHDRVRASPRANRSTCRSPNRSSWPWPPASCSPGDRLEPVRELAARLGLNPSTVARAYRLLERQGVIETGGRRGSRVADAAAAGGAGMLRQMRLRALAARAVVEGLAQGFVPDELEAALGLELAAWRERRRGGAAASRRARSGPPRPLRRQPRPGAGGPVGPGPPPPPAAHARAALRGQPGRPAGPAARRGGPGRRRTCWTRRAASTTCRSCAGCSSACRCAW